MHLLTEPFFSPGNKIRYRNVHLHHSFWPKSQDLYSNKDVSVCISQRAVSDPSRAWLMAFSSPVHSFAYDPHTGIFSIVLQWKHVWGRTGHMKIIWLLSWLLILFPWEVFFTFARNKRCQEIQADHNQQCG